MAGKRARHNPSRDVTMREIAEHAGVSKATVSRVINGIPSVKVEIADRVRESIAQLGFVPSQTARSLSLGVSRTIGVLVPDLSNPMVHEILTGLHRAAAASGYRVLIADSFEDEALEASTAVDMRTRTDALVLVSPRMDRLELLELLPRVQPVAVVNRTTGQNAVVVQVDYARAIRELVTYLRGLGHEHLVFLSGPAQSRSNNERLRGLEEAQENDPAVRIDVLSCGSSFDEGHRSWDAVRATGATGVIAYNDVVALGLLGRLSELGVVVPRDLSVVGIDDIAYARYSSPPLTTMSVDLQRLGESVWDDLEAEIRGAERREPTVFVPELVQRDSASAPLAAG